MDQDRKTRADESAPGDDDVAQRLANSLVSRRGFLQGAGALGAAMGGEALFPPLSFAQSEWRHEADIVVVGTGSAGNSAALNAHRLGNTVIMLEKAATYGGTVLAGEYWVPNNFLMRAAGVQDSREGALRYMVRVAYPHLYNARDPYLGVSQDQYEVLAAFYENASPALETLQSMTTIRSTFKLAGDGKPALDYRSDLPESRQIRGRSLGTKTATGGENLTGPMRDAVLKAGIPILYNSRASQLLLNKKGEVVGFAVTTPDGLALPIRARKAVIFASGGFTHSRRLRLDFLRAPTFGGCAVPTNEGDFLQIAAAAGASFANMNNAWWTEIALEQAVDSPGSLTGIFYLRGDSMFLVNRYGRRIVNEGLTYNDRTQVHFTYDPGRDEYTNLLLFLIYDQRTAEQAAGSFPIPRPGASASHVVTGQTIEQLAQALATRLDRVADRTGNFQLDPGFLKQLEQTVARFNEFAERGVDDDFHRGETLFEKINASPTDSGKPNRTLYPISAKGPYYATIIAAGTLDTKGGPRINARAQVLDTNGKPIPGLYGAGNCVAFPAGQAYWGYGGTIAPALTFGYIAAREASNEPLKEPDAAPSTGRIAG